MPICVVLLMCLTCATDAHDSNQNSLADAPDRAMGQDEICFVVHSLGLWHREERRCMSVAVWAVGTFQCCSTNSRHLRGISTSIAGTCTHLWHRSRGIRGALPAHEARAAAAPPPRTTQRRWVCVSQARLGKQQQHACRIHRHVVHEAIPQAHEVMLRVGDIDQVCEPEHTS